MGKALALQGKGKCKNKERWVQHLTMPPDFYFLSFIFSLCVFFEMLETSFWRRHTLSDKHDDWQILMLKSRSMWFRSNYLIKIAMVLIQLSWGEGGSFTTPKKINLAFKFIGSKFINFLDQNGEHLKSRALSATPWVSQNSRNPGSRLPSPFWSHPYEQLGPKLCSTCFCRKCNRSRNNRLRDRCCFG